MKKTIFFITICLLLSCRKTDEPPQAIPPPLPQPDNILYHDLQPDTIIRSVRYYIPNTWDPMSCGDTPVPADSLAEFSFDINGDAIHDFSLTTYHNPGSGSMGSNHCEHVFFGTRIKGINPGDSISYVLQSGIKVPVRYDLNSNTTIPFNALWSSSATIKAKAQGYYAGYSVNFAAMYIGVKVNTCCGWIRVSPAGNNGISIIDYAINLTPYNSIEAGQIQ